MTTLTMIWNDCHCNGVSDHHWHTMEFDATVAELKEWPQEKLVRSIMLTHYEKQAADQDEALGPAPTPEDESPTALTEAAIFDYGLVGIFIGVPEEL